MSPEERINKNCGICGHEQHENYCEAPGHMWPAQPFDYCGCPPPDHYDLAMMPGIGDI